MKSTFGFRPSLPYGARLVKRRGVRWYQADGSVWLADPRNRVLADPMRSGKTMQWLLSLPTGARGLVICPAIAKGVWMQETRFWRDDLTPAFGKVRRPNAGEVVIASYGSMPEPTEGWTRRLIPESLADVYVAFDEAQMIKGEDADRTVACRLLGCQALRVNGLAGAPMLGGLGDLWGVLASCRATWPWSDSRKAFVSDSEREDFSERLRLVLLRRELSVIAPSLPPITIQEVPIETPTRLLAQLDALYASWGIEAGKLPAVGKGSHVLRLLAESRIEDAIQLVRSVVESGKAVLVFSCHVEPVLAMGRVKRSGCITGETPEEERRALIDRFQAGPLGGLDVLAMTVDTGGVSIKLDRASVVIEVDQDYTPDVNNQAIARAVDLVKKEPIHVYRMIGTHPQEKRVMEIRRRKEAETARVLKGLSGL